MGLHSAYKPSAPPQNAWLGNSERGRARSSRFHCTRPGGAETHSKCGQCFRAKNAYKFPGLYLFQHRSLIELRLTCQRKHHMTVDRSTDVRIVWNCATVSTPALNSPQTAPFSSGQSRICLLSLRIYLPWAFRTKGIAYVTPLWPVSS